MQLKTQVYFKRYGMDKISTCLFFWLELEEEEVECLLREERSMGAGLADGEECRLLPYTELVSSSSSRRTFFAGTEERTPLLSATGVPEVGKISSITKILSQASLKKL